MSWMFVSAATVPKVDVAGLVAGVVAAVLSAVIAGVVGVYCYKSRKNAAQRAR